MHCIQLREWLSFIGLKNVVDCRAQRKVAASISRPICTPNFLVHIMANNISHQRLPILSRAFKSKHIFEFFDILE